MEDEAHSDYLGAHFHSEDPHEDGFELLQLQGEDGFVVTSNSGVHGHDDTVAHDGDDDEPFEGRPGHEPDKQSPDWKKIRSCTSAARESIQVQRSVFKIQDCFPTNLTKLIMLTYHLQFL